jgi:hypothetical protein
VSPSACSFGGWPDQPLDGVIIKRHTRPDVSRK